MRNLVIIIVLILLGIGVYYFFFRNAPAAMAPSTPETPTQDTSAAAPVPTSTNASVSIASFSFSPATLSVKVGTRVVWTNNDNVPHTITSDSGSLLDSKTIAPGQSFSFTFTSAGTFNYHCSIHPMMKGAVVVTN